LDARGYLSVTGRLKELIIRGGENISPAEIERRPLDHETVLEASVVGMPDERWGEIRCRGDPDQRRRPDLLVADIVDYVEDAWPPSRCLRGGSSPTPCP